MRDFASAVTRASRKWNFIIWAVAAVLGLAIGSLSASGQSGAGAIQGTVTDQTGAVITGAAIQVVNKATGMVSNTKSNRVGFFQSPGLFTGSYDVTVMAPNMKTYERSVELMVDQAAVINPVMTPGEVTQRVEVNADSAQLVDKENGTLGTTLERGRIDQIPMNGRVLTTLTNMTVPGIESGAASNPTGTGQRVNGLMTEALEYVADGVPMNNLQFGGQANSFSGILPDPDSVQEVEVETSNTSAAYTTPGTAVVTTKSGTNQLHGSFFETARNNALGVAKQRQNLNTNGNFSTPPYIRNEFGASIGGPVVLPHVYHGKDKSFFFFAYERYSLVNLVSSAGLTVPTAAEKNGDFSAMKNSTGLVAIYDPSTTAPSSTCVNNLGAISNSTWCRKQFAYNGNPNTINPALLDPETKILLAMSPPPTSADNPLITSNLTTPNKTVQIIPTITFRLDHAFNEKNKAFLRYTQTYQADDNLYAGNYETLASGPFPAGASGLAVNSDTNFGAAVGYTHIFSPRFFAETNIGQQWFMEFSGGGGPHTDFTSLLGLPNPFNVPGFPSIGGMNTTGFTGNQNQYQQNSIDSRIEENLTKIEGRHQLQFGGLYRHERIFYLPSQQPQGPNFANGQTTGLENPNTGTSDSAWTNTGLADADYYLGGATSYKVELEPIGASYRIQTLAGYFQDDWHAKRNLTVNIGLRYEAHPGQKATDNITLAPDLNHAAIVLGDSISDIIAKGRTTQAIITAMQNVGVVFETPAQAGFPSSLFENDYAIFLPRLGFSYQPFGDKHGSVIRGGYGRYTYQMADRSENPTPTSAPFTEAYTQAFTNAAQTPDNLPNYNLRAPQNNSPSWTLGSTGTPVLGVNTSNAVNINITNPLAPGGILPGVGIGGVDPDYKPDFVTEANVTVEQALKGNSVARIGWVFTHGTNLDQGWRPNIADSTYAWEMNTGTPPPNGGTSTIGTCQYAATALNPWNCTTYGDFYYYDKTGWSNHNALQASYQRLMHRGFAFQAIYVWSRSFRLGGNSTRDGATYTAQGFASGSLAQLSLFPSGIATPSALPPPRPAGLPTYAQWHGLERFEQYNLDPAIPQQHLQFNWVYDLPFGRGKWLLGNANKFADELAGGWQFAGDAQVVSQDFQVGSSNWGAFNKLVTYKHNQPKVTDCTSGVCHPEYLWFNGYISPKQIAGPGGTCVTNCISGLPTNYVPYETPINNDPTQAQFGTNNIMLSSPALLASNKGSPVTVNYLPYTTSGFSSNPYSHSFLRGPVNYLADLSLYKVFPITERANFRLNWDVFNAFNIQGLNNPNTGSGLQAIQPGVSGGASSFWANGREVQLTARLTF